MLTIRLQRTGRRNAPTYRVVVQEKQKDPWAPAIEFLGHYNPRTQPSTVELKTDRIKHWIEKGAQPSNTMNNLLINEGIIEGEKAKSIRISDKRRAKMEEKKREAQEKAKEKTEKKSAEEKKESDKKEEKEEPEKPKAKEQEKESKGSEESEESEDKEEEKEDK